MYKHLIGKNSNKVLNRVEYRSVKYFAESIGDEHPLYTDPNYSANSIYRKNIAPATYPIIFDYGEIDGFKLPKVGLLHGEQQFHYNRPLFLGEQVFCYSKVKDYYEKRGSSGTLGFIVIDYTGEDSTGDIIYWLTSVYILTETVKERV